MTDTSRAARPTPEKASRGRQIIYAAYLAAGRFGLTSDEAAHETGLPVLYARPRISELKAFGELIDTGDRRANRSGKTAAVLSATSEALDRMAQAEMAF